MELVYTTLRPANYLRRHPEWLAEGDCLSAVSSQNTLIFTSSTLISGPEPPISSWGCHLYCADLNTPWDSSLLTSLDSPCSSLAWHPRASRLVCADRGGGVAVWEMEENNIGEWRQVSSVRYNHEHFIAASFFPRSRTVGLNSEQKDSALYSEKFSSSEQGRSVVDGCLLVSSSGLVLAQAFTSDPEPLLRTASLGLGRRRLVTADIGTTEQGELLVAAGDEAGLVVVYSVSLALDTQEDLSLQVCCHSSFSPASDLPGLGPGLQVHFLLSDMTSSLAVGVGGRLELWDLTYSNRTVHKVLSSAGGAQSSELRVPGWRLGAELNTSSSLLSLTSPQSSVMAGPRPASYLALAFSDGTVQLLLRDSSLTNLALVKSVELARADNTPWARSSTISSLNFTASSNCLVVTDSLGQLYLYSVSPISDPGGPSQPPYTVTCLELALVSGRDCWDTITSADPLRLEAVCDKFCQSFARQPPGQQQYFYSRFMAIKSTLHRVNPSSQYKAADCNALLMLRSIAGAFKGLLKSSDNSLTDSDPGDKLEIMLSNQDEDNIEIVIQHLVKAGLSRDVEVEPASLRSLHQLSLWVSTLSLHLLAAVPEFKVRKGPGFTLLHDGESLQLVRSLLTMVRLWNLSKLNIICTEKEMDLTARLFSMVSRLSKKMDDEALLDECLMLPHRVLIPPLDTVLAARGVLSSLHSIRSSQPLSFTFGTEPDITTTLTPPFVEGLTYIDNPHADFYYDSIQKLYLGQSPGQLKQCTRCRSVTQSAQSSSTFALLWDKRWSRNCLCGGPWKLMRESTVQ